MDRYTKVVLTVIAAALVWIGAALTTVPTAQATQHAAGIQQVNIVEVGGLPVGGRSGDGTITLPVRVVP